MEKKGFTLVELIAVIVILSIILLISIPVLVNNIQAKKGTASDRVYKLIETAAQNYLIDYSIDGTVSIPIKSLCDRYIECPIIDPYTGEEIDGYISPNDDGSYSVTGEVKLLLELNGGSTTQSFEDNYPPYTTITIIPPTKENYDFLRWEVVKGNGRINGNNLTIGNVDTTIYAMWRSYPSLTVDLNEGTSSQSFEASYSSGTTFTLINPTRAGYTFNGWEVIEGDSIISGNSFTMGSKDTKIKATWTETIYTITYNLDGGSSGTNAPTSGTYGKTVTVDNPTKTGYTFNGWTVSGTGASMSGTSLTIGTNDVTLTANWTANTYTVTYNLDGGTKGSSAPTSGTYDSVLTIDNPTRTGYTFNGWTVTSGLNTSTAKYGTSSSSVTTAISSSSTKVTATYFKNLTATNGESITLTANWTVNTYTITYNLDGGTSGTNAPTSGTYGSTVTVDNPTKTGYTFNGWTVSGTGASMSGTSLTIGAGNITLTANWTIKVITVTFDRNYGTSTTASQTFTYGASGNKFGYNTDGTAKWGTSGQFGSWDRTGYTLLGWAKTSTATTNNYSTYSGVSDSWINSNYPSITLYAVWQINTYTITYNLSSGTKGANAPTSGTYGSTVTVDNPTRTGYKFTGWTVSGTGASMSGTNLTIGAGNVTLTANWQITDTTAPTCTLSASAGSTTITAKASDTGGSGVAGKGFSTSYGGETTKKVSATGTIKYYVKDGAGNTGSCSATISATTENCECGAGFPQSGACYIGVIVDGKWTGNKYYKECDYSYSCSSGTKLSNSYCFKAN